MADNDKRLRYYNGQFLREKDFTDEQQYHLDRQRRHNRQLHSYGIAEGLTVTAETGATTVTVSPGTAIDGEGRVIVLAESRPVGLSGLSGPALVVISYREEASDPATTGDIQETRFWERPDIEVIAEANAPSADAGIRLARLEILDGKLKNPPNPGVRTSAGKVGAGALKVQSPLGSSAQFVQDQNGNQSPLAIGTGKVGIGTDESECVLTVAGNASFDAMAEVRSQGNEASIRYVNNNGGLWHAGVGAANNFFFWNKPTNAAARLTPDGTLIANGVKLSAQGTAAEVTGDVSVTGKISVTGTVDGRDISADGIKLDTLASSTIEGVSNPGGNIDLVGQKGIIVTGTNSTKTITIENAAGNLKVQNPLSDTLQFVKDQNNQQSPVLISTTTVEINTESEQANIFRVAGNVSGPLVEVRSRKKEATIRYLSLDEADKVAWHVGTGGGGGPKNFFFWNDKKGVVARITPEGDLSVTGNVLVTGTVDGRDVSADGQKLDTLASSTIEGVANPGGNIDLIGENGIIVTGDSSAKTIKIANAAGNLRTQSSLSDTLQFVKDQNGIQSPVLISTTTVEINTEIEQANIFRVAGNVSGPLMEVRSRKKEATIRYLSLDEADKVAWHVGTGGGGGPKNFFFWNDKKGVVARITPEGDLSVTGNVLVTGTVDGRDVSADGARLDALASSRFLASATFSQDDGDGATRTINTPFRPKFISMEGSFVAFLHAGKGGGAIGGFCHCDQGGGLLMKGHGPEVIRHSNYPFVEQANRFFEDRIAYAEVADRTMGPWLNLIVGAAVVSVTNVGFGVKLMRAPLPTQPGVEYRAPNFFLSMAFAVLG